MIGTVPPVLHRARGMAGPAIRARVAALEPGLRRVVDYHLGFADAAGNAAQGNGGKAVRAALALLSAQAAGEHVAIALPGAVAVELVHNFSLLHDDVMDRDEERRHRTTAWAVFGEGPAILAGDALLILANDALLEESTPHRVRAARALSDATARMIEGQAEDLSFEPRRTVGLEECRRMMAHKTGALLSCAASIGAILAGAPAPVVDSLVSFGLHLGLSFQAVDDLLGIWGAPDVTGKPAANDIRQGKKSLPIAAALEAGGRGAERLADLLALPPRADDDVHEAAALVEALGGRDRTQEEAERQLSLALESLAAAPLESAARLELEELARFIVDREF